MTGPLPGGWLLTGAPRPGAADAAVAAATVGATSLVVADDVVAASLGVAGAMPDGLVVLEAGVARPAVRVAHAVSAVVRQIASAAEVIRSRRRTWLR
jgi:hypothetical protein